MKKMIYIGIFIIFAFLISPASGVTSHTTAMKNPGVYVSETSSFQPSEMDPATNYETQGGSLLENVYETLLDYAGNSVASYKPLLATSYTISPDGLTYTFTLRTGVTFSDGQPFNAYAMKYSLDRAILLNDHGSGAWIIQQAIYGGNDVAAQDHVTVDFAKAYLALESVKAVDANTLQITQEYASGAFISEIIFRAGSAISPKAVIDNEPSTYTTDMSDETYGMVPLTYFFPGMDNATILSNLGLPANYDLGNSGVVPQGDTLGEAGHTWLATHSAGTGPYVLGNIEAGVEGRLEKNPNWWNAANFAADSVDEVVVKQVAETATRVLDLKNGDADSGGIPNSNLGEVMNLTTRDPLFSNLQVISYPSFTTGAVFFNFNDTLPNGQVNEYASSSYSRASDNYTRLLKYSWNDADGNPQYASKDNPMTSLLFRKALALSFDYDAYIKNVLNGFGSRLEGTIPLGFLGHVSDLIDNGNIPSYDPATATSLFKQVGFKGELAITYNTGSTGRQQTAQLFKDGVEALGVGITITIREIVWSQFLDETFTGKTGIFQLGWAPDYPDPDNYAVPYLRSDGLFGTSMNYNNHFVDTLIDEAGHETNPGTRIVDYYDMEINSTGDYPMIYLSQGENVLVRSAYIFGMDVVAYGAQNPMKNGLPFAFLSKAETAPTTQPTLTETLAAPGTGTDVAQASKNFPVPPTSETPVSSSTPDTTAQSSSSSSDGPTPGFELISLLGMLLVSTVIVGRKRKN
jgi:peptide/nickel transport system substrate-binding protein